MSPATAPPGVRPLPREPRFPSPGKEGGRPRTAEAPPEPDLAPGPLPAKPYTVATGPFGFAFPFPFFSRPAVAIQRFTAAM